eukprot:22543_1
MAQMMKKVTPLLDRVLVKKILAPTKTASGILLPDTVKNKLNEGLVVACGPGLSIDGQTIPMPLNVGDKVLLPEFGGSRLDLGSDDEHFLYRADDILAVINE